MKVSIAGVEGELVRLEGETLQAILDRAFAPGAPVRASAIDLAIEAKAIGSRRREDGRYDVRLRLINLRRSERDRLAALLASEPRD